MTHTAKRCTALLLCLALVFCMSPIRAEAMTASAFLLLYGDDILNALLAICKGLGVSWITLEAADRAMQGLLDDMQSVDHLWTDGGIQVLQYIGGDGIPRNCISLEMIEWVRQWLFDNAVVNESAVATGFASYNGVVLPDLSKVPKAGMGENNTNKVSYTYDYHFLLRYISNGAYFLYCQCTGASSVYVDSLAYVDGESLKMGYAEYCRVVSDGSKWDLGSRYSSRSLDLTQYEIVWTNRDILDAQGNVFFAATDLTYGEFVGAEDVELGQVVAPESDLAEGYTQWATGAATVGDSVYYPVTMGPTLEDTLSQTQEQSWTGVASFDILTVNCSYKSDSDDGAVYLGSVVQLLANVAGSGTYTPGVTWSWYEGSGPLSSTTTLTADGTLTIGLDETATFLTAVATSVADPTKFGTVTISVTLTEAPAVPSAPSDIETWIGTLVDSIAGIFTDSKSEAAAEGGAAIDNVVAVIPDYSLEFVAALTDFAGVMGYEGTDAVLTLPALQMPAVAGLVPEYQLLEEQRINLEDYAAMMPEWLLLLIQCLFTAALIAYCPKELYSTIEYLLTLRGGARDV